MHEVARGEVLNPEIYNVFLDKKLNFVDNSQTNEEIKLMPNK